MRLLLVLRVVRRGRSLSGARDTEGGVPATRIASWIEEVRLGNSGGFDPGRL